MKNLTTCPDCGREISKNAAACPNCGKSMKTSAVNILAGIVLSIGGLFLALFFIGSAVKFINSPTEQPKSEVKGEIFIHENGQKYPFETASVRIYQTDKIKEMTADEIEETIPDAIAATNADGMFSVKIPNGDYTAIADASRAVNKQVENYHWKTRVTVLNEETELIFNNQNLSSE